jgi:small-conductance mechanosensitive channel
LRWCHAGVSNLMSEAFTNFLVRFPWLVTLGRIVIFYLAALVLSFILKAAAKRVLALGRFSLRERKYSLQRQKTLQSLVSSAIALFSFLAATLASAALFIAADTLAWVLGLFSAAFGLGARPLISDYLAGISFIFEDTFSVGEKIELPGSQPIEGIIETINLRTTAIRASSGELYVVPNGEIRTVRNFSRGKFSLANIILNVSSNDLGRALPFLEDLGKEAVLLLPNLLEPWQVISESGVIGQNIELTLIAKAKFGRASEMRPRLLALVQERLMEVDISLAN